MGYYRSPNSQSSLSHGENQDILTGEDHTPCFAEEFEVAPVLGPVKNLQNRPSRSMLDPVGVGLSADGIVTYIGAQINSLWICAVGLNGERRLPATDIAFTASHACISADGRTSAFAGSYGVIVSVLGQYIAANLTPAASVSLSADGKVVAIASFPTTVDAGYISICTSEDMSEISRWSADLNFSQCSIAISGDASLVVHAVIGGAYLVDVSTAERLFFSKTRGESDVSIDLAGRTIAIADEHALRVMHVNRYGKKEAAIRMRAYSPPSFDPKVDLSGNGKFVVAAIAEYKYGVFCTKFGNLVLILDGQNGISAGVAASYDAQIIVAAAHPEEANVWDLKYHLSKNSVIGG